MNPTVEMRKCLSFLKSAFPIHLPRSCLPVIEAIYTSHTSQLTRTLRLLEREVGEKETARLFFPPGCLGKKRPLGFRKVSISRAPSAWQMLEVKDDKQTSNLQYCLTRISSRVIAVYKIARSTKGEHLRKSSAYFA